MRVTVVEGTVAVFTVTAPQAAQRVAAGYEVESGTGSALRGPSTRARPSPGSSARSPLKTAHWARSPRSSIATGASSIEIKDQELRSLPISGVFDAYDTDSFATFLGTLDGVQVEKTPTRILVRKLAPATREPLPHRHDSAWDRAQPRWTVSTGDRCEEEERSGANARAAPRTRVSVRLCSAFFSPSGRAGPERIRCCRSTSRRSPWRVRSRNLRIRRGLQVIYVSRLARARTSKGARAGLTPAEALPVLLEGTGLSFEFLNERTVRIFEPPSAPLAAPPTGASDAPKQPGSPRAALVRRAR